MTMGPVLGDCPSHAQAHATGTSTPGSQLTLPRQRMELRVSLAKLELDKVVLRETRTGMRVMGGR